jgi:hypothetical protein
MHPTRGSIEARRTRTQNATVTYRRHLQESSMFRQLRLLFALLTVTLGAVASCVRPDATVAPVMRVGGSPTPTFDRVKATDSLMAVTDVAYSDTAVGLPRLTPLDTDVSASALIGRNGGTIEIPSQGVRVDFAPFALSTPTTITVTAVHGSLVAYEFQPHGINFMVPVRIEQDVAYTKAAAQPSLLTGLHGAYYDLSLAQSTVDAVLGKVLIRENQLSYVEATKRKIRIYVGHFSGYLLSSGVSQGMY